MKRFILLLCIGVLCIELPAQIFTYDDEPFAFRVKQLDEFIERFNFKENTVIRDYIKKKYPQVNINRQSLLLGLFNRENPAFFPPNRIPANDSISYIVADTQVISNDSFIVNCDTLSINNVQYTMSLVEEFVFDMTDSLSPTFISFYDDNWFAKISCVFRYEDQLHDCILLMKNQSNQESTSSRWVIADVAADFLEIPASDDLKKILNPMSHATDFLALNRVLEDKSNLRNYFIREFGFERRSVFFYELYKGNLVLEEIKKISYHFLQVDGWIFTLNYYNRRSNNSGWLISDLVKADDSTKVQYLKLNLLTK